jgi:hypothetical protein
MEERGWEKTSVVGRYRTEYRSIFPECKQAERGAPFRLRGREWIFPGGITWLAGG